jgi:anti-sigma factor RsiW
MTPTGDLTCRELVELVADYLEGALTPAERARFERHIAACRGCRAYLEQMRLTAATLGRLTEEQVAPEAEAALVRAFRGWKRR